MTIHSYYNKVGNESKDDLPVLVSHVRKYIFEELGFFLVDDSESSVLPSEHLLLAQHPVSSYKHLT
jgi:hypothetical protein